MIKHKKYIKALEHCGVKTVYGRFKKVNKFCTRCNEYYESHEEKKTDVNIAIKIFQEAVDDNFDIAIIISGDSDLIPSIEAVKSSFPHKKFGVVVPFNRAADELKQVAHFHMKMKEKHLSSSRLSNSVTLANGEVVTCPTDWQ